LFVVDHVSAPLHGSQVTFGRLSGLASLAVRGSVAKTPYFPETISCLVVIRARQGDQGTIRALMVGQKDGKPSAISERFKGRDRGVVPDSESGWKWANSILC
jgi:hypothetical protein